MGNSASVKLNDKRRWQSETAMSPAPPAQRDKTSATHAAVKQSYATSVGKSMTPHVQQAVAQARAARHLLRPVLDSSLPLRAKLGIYKAYIRTRLTYAAPAWYALVSESNKKRLRAQQSLTLRTIVKAPRFVRNATITRDLGVESVDDFVQRLSTNMFERASKSRHDHLRALAPYHRRPPDGYGLPRDLVAPTDPPDAAT